MPRYKTSEPNLLTHYFHEDSATYQIIAGMRDSFLRGETRNFPQGIVDRAKAEVATKSRALDASTYQFAQALNQHIYHGGKRRVIMLVEGVFRGDEDIDSIIPIDLGVSPYQLFKQVGSTTVDDFVTSEQTMRFIGNHRDELSQRGANAFEVGKSRFFYFSHSDLAEFFDKDMDPKAIVPLDELVRLVPMIVPTQGYVALRPVEEPTLEEYLESAPVHVSYRLKKSLATKLLNKLGSPKDSIQLGGNPEGNGSSKDVIVDWVAHRPVVPSIGDVDSLEDFFRGNPTLGKSDVNHLYTKDYYRWQKASEFMAKNVVARVAHPGSEPSIREIQIVDKGQYFINELRNGITSHKEHEKKRSQQSRRRRKFDEHYGPVLENIFGEVSEFIKI